MLSATLLILPLVLLVPLAFCLAFWIAATARPGYYRAPRRAPSRAARVIRIGELAQPSSADPAERARRCRRMARLFPRETAQALGALARQFENEARKRASNQ